MKQVLCDEMFCSNGASNGFHIKACVWNLVVADDMAPI